VPILTFRTVSFFAEPENLWKQMRVHLNGIPRTTLLLHEGQFHHIKFYGPRNLRLENTAQIHSS